MNEHYFKLDQAYSFMRYSSILPKRKTLLFLHGIGDSSLTYVPFFQEKSLANVNILVPDILGYGKSSANYDYSFEFQTKVIIAHLKALEQDLNCTFDDLILIPHSMGNIYAMLLCQSEISSCVKSVVSVEGSITQFGSFVSDTASHMVELNQFDSWFQEFKEHIIFDKWIAQFPSCHSYYASLKFCQPAAFLQNALELHTLAHAGTGKYTNTIGHQFAQLNLPKIYCYGNKSLCHESVNFLLEDNIPVKSFETDNHFVMIECFHQFVSFLTEWLCKSNIHH